MIAQKNALAVREALEAGHPEIAIKSPLTSLSGRWELSTDGGTTTYSNFWLMVDFLAGRYDNDEPGDEDDEPE